MALPSGRTNHWALLRACLRPSSSHAGSLVSFAAHHQICKFIMVSMMVSSPFTPQEATRLVNPKFLTGSDGILLIRQEIIQSSISNYWQQGEQRIGLGLQPSRLWHLLKAWGGVFRFQPIGRACSTG